MQTLDEKIDRLCDEIARKFIEKRNQIDQAARDKLELGKRIIARRDEILKQRTEKPMFEISPETIAYVKSRRLEKAAAPLPLDPIGAIHKANASATLSPTHYADLMKRVADANNAEIAKSKGKVPVVEHASTDDKDVDWSDDKQATAAYRREQAAKASGRSGPPNAQNRFSTRTETGINDETDRPLETQAHHLNTKG